MFVIQHYKFNAFIANHQLFNYLVFIELTLINSGVTGITLNVTPEDLLYLVKQTIEAAKNELLPVMVSAAKEALLTKQEVMEKFGVCHTTLWNWGRNNILIPVKVGKKVCYRQSDVERLILEKGK